MMTEMLGMFDTAKFGYVTADQRAFIASGLLITTIKLFKWLIQIGARQVFEVLGEVPVVVACVAANGSALMLRCAWNEARDGLNVENLAENIEGSGFELPVNIMVVDATGAERHAV